MLSSCHRVKELATCENKNQFQFLIRHYKKSQSSHMTFHILTSASILTQLFKLLPFPMGSNCNSLISVLQMNSVPAFLGISVHDSSVGRRIISMRPSPLFPQKVTH